ncbi:hypothetical protein JO972_08740 [Verrucomicrobiaceae bacterium 5K15]|uniref:Uncharacterized protein n=1 Tax=Oceaniferula flava TaxID=2800421 RepID=A0AAE2V9F9_9BACT|nr:hypothetical protein [Oceaniferula flavus]MBK1855043.1 hypothetical protein [Oceaniferula flavus]MBM1136349.1 hypothetical protein [Oceaniferula flavus]
MKIGLLTIIAFAGLSSLIEAAPVKIKVEAKTALLANDFITAKFDLDSRRFSILDSQNGEILLENSEIKTKMKEGASLYVHRQEAVVDAFGKGQRLVLALSDYGLYRYSSHFKRRGLPAQQLFSYTLYENHPAIILGFGLKTPNYFSMRLRDITVLDGGRLFGGKEVSQSQTLNGSAGMDSTLVIKGLDRISCNSLLLTGKVNGKRRSIVWGGLGNKAYAKIATLKAGVLGLYAEDPIGILVDEDKDYLSEDTFYLDLTGLDPFETLERYGKAVRIANNASPNVYQAPVLCGWSVSHISKLPNINNSAKLVQEAELAKASQLTKYTEPMLRLEPDKYHLDTEQGWWDDQRFRQYGHLVPPYETVASWCKALEERGCSGYTYMQLGMPSDDFAKAHPEWMLFNDISELDRRGPGYEDKKNKHNHHQPYVTYDYTDKEYSKHFVKVWSAIRKAGVRGVKVDYPATAWRPEGGFDDRYASTNSAYRRAFSLLREAMGEDGLIDERNLGESGRPCLDLTAGLVDTQRTWGDDNKFVPEMVSRSGLRWYKNRTVFNYYSDTKAVHGLTPENLQSLITMNFLTSGRLDLATSYSLFTPEVTRIVSRSYPHYQEPMSARPLDAFTDISDPQVYELELTPDWRQVALYNTGAKRTIVSTALSGDRTTNAIGLDPSASYHGYEFWSDTYLGKIEGSGRVEQELEPGHCAMISVRKALDHPQVISTNRHLLQGWVDLTNVRWDESKRSLSGTAKVIAGEEFKIVIANNGIEMNQVKVDKGLATIAPHPTSRSLKVLSIESSQSGEVDWRVTQSH